MRLHSFLTLFTRATPGTPARGGNGKEEGKVQKSWQGPGVGRKGGGGRLDKKEWGGEGETGLGQWGGDWEGAMERERWGGGQREGGDGKVAKGRGRRRGKRRIHFTDGYDLMS